MKTTKKLWLYTLLLFGAILMLLNSCEKKEVVIEYGSIKGIVSDESTGLPLYNAYIQIGDNYATFTGYNGEYELNDMPVATYAIESSLEDYSIHSQSITITANTQLTYNIALQDQLSKLSGIIKDENEEPLQGASINISSSNSNYSVNSEPNGSFVFERIQPDTYIINIIKEGYVSKADTFALVSAEHKVYNTTLAFPYWSAIYSTNNTFNSLVITSTGTMFYYHSGLVSGYLMRSVDNGYSFQSSNPFSSGTVIDKIFEIENVLFVFGSKGQDLSGNFIGECALYRSTNDGSTWSKVMDLNNFLQIDGLNMVSTNENNFFFLFYGATGPIINPSYIYSLYNSSNAGVNWSIINPNQNLSEIKNIFSSLTGKTFIRFNDNNNSTQYYYSIDNGLTWTEGSYSSTTLQALFKGFNLPSGEIVSIHSENFYISNDDGVNWSITPIDFYNIHDVSNNGIIITNLNKTVYTSLDKGSTWVKLGDDFQADGSINTIRANSFNNHVYVASYSGSSMKIYKSKFALQ